MDAIEILEWNAALAAMTDNQLEEFLIFAESDGELINYELIVGALEAEIWKRQHGGHV